MKELPSGLAALLLLVPGVLAGERHTESCGSQFLLRVHGEQTRVVKGGALQLQVEVFNSGSEPKWVYKNLALGVWLHIFDSSGSEVQPGVVYEHYPPSRMRASDFSRVLPGHSLVLHDKYSEGDLRLPQGRYMAKIEFMFMPTPPQVFASACSGWLRSADEVPFEIVE